MATWLATGPPGIACSVPVTVVTVVEAVGVLDHAAGHEQDREHERERQQDPQRGADQVDPEVADRASARRGRARG